MPASVIVASNRAKVILAAIDLWLVMDSEDPGETMQALKNLDDACTEYAGFILDNFHRIPPHELQERFRRTA